MFEQSQLSNTSLKGQLRASNNYRSFNFLHVHSTEADISIFSE